MLKHNKNLNNNLCSVAFSDCLFSTLKVLNTQRLQVRHKPLSTIEENGKSIFDFVQHPKTWQYK